MKNTISTMPHKRVLFLISLPGTPEFEKEREDVEECLNELRSLQVDVRERITYEDLANICCYDIVIVVAHYNSEEDALVLSDGVMKMSDFVSSLPFGFKGVLDFSSCYSATAYQAIKNRCPQCRIQAALVEVRLLQRIIMYPSLIGCLNENPDIDYHDAYKEVSAAFDEFVGDYEKGLDVPEMTRLGQQVTSIYSPSEVKLNTPFQIMVFFHYDSEREVVKVKAQRWQTNALIRDDFEIPIEMNEGDKIAITLGFDSPDNVNIVENDGEYRKYITLKKEMAVEKFKVTVLPMFKGNGFLANIEMAKDDICFVKCAFNIDIADHENNAPTEVVAEIPRHQEEPENIIAYYTDVFTGRLLGHTNYRQFNSILQKKENKNSAEQKIFFIRKYVYNNDLFIRQLNSFLQDKEEELLKLLRKDEKSSEVTFELVPLLKNYISRLQKKLASLEGKFLYVKKAKSGIVCFEESLLKFLPVEWEFIDLLSEFKNLDYQIDMLSVFWELRNEVKSECKKGIIKKDKIKDLTNQFLEHPHYDYVDQDLYGLFKTSGTGSIIHPKSQGATMPFLALVLAMVEQEYISTDRGKEDWFINIDRYIDFRKNTGSLRTAKNRINKLVSLLDRKDIREKIRKYQKTEAGKISITAYYLQKIKVSVI
ncbi:MAG: hypothetical protein J6W52_12725 [Bacteroidaceae bacterium]|nr:hypothetical protein [Bacteroidaceae bacterium]